MSFYITREERMLQEAVDKELAQSVRIILHFRSNTSKSLLRLMGGLTSARWYST